MRQTKRLVKADYNIVPPLPLHRIQCIGELHAQRPQHVFSDSKRSNIRNAQDSSCDGDTLAYASLKRWKSISSEDHLSDQRLLASLLGVSGLMLFHQIFSPPPSQMHSVFLWTGYQYLESNNLEICLHPDAQTQHSGCRCSQASSSCPASLLWIGGDRRVYYHLLA